jgi:ABC-type transport system involved in cytochrome c biogenesis permease subunit
LNALKQILSPFASLKLTIVLLLLSMVLVLAGTTAQRDMDIQAVQHQFFHSWLAKVDIHDFQPMPSAKPGHTPQEGYLPGYFYLPGGFSLIILMLVNLVAAHTVRFKLRVKRIGIILIHSGLILLLVGELMTSYFAVESVMRIDDGATTNFAEDIRYPELAVADHSAADHDAITTISQTALEKASGGKTIHDSRLPFDVKVDKYYENSMWVGPAQNIKSDRLATAGAGKIFGILSRPKVTGAGGEASMTNIPSAFITLSHDGKNLGTYLVSMLFDRSTFNYTPGQSQPVVVDGKTYTIDLRFRRYYKPYTIHLKHFTHETIAGTTMAKNYASTIQLVAPSSHVDREVKIWMNHPLRFNYDTFYQQSFANNDKTTILQVVHNPASLMPYIACVVGALGLLTHFGMTLTLFLRRRLAPTPGTVGATGYRPPVRSKGDGKKGSGARLPAPISDRYTLTPEPAWKMAGLPLAAFAIAFIWIAMQFFNSAPTRPFDLEAFGHLPVFIDGRAQPLDSAARNFLGIVSGGRTEFRDDKGDVHPAIEWLTDLMTRSHKWADDKVIRIDHPQLKDLFGLKETEKLFSWNDIKLDDPQVREKLEHQVELAQAVGDKERDPFQNAVIELSVRLGAYYRWLQIDAINSQLEMDKNPGRVEAAKEGVRDALMSANPKIAAAVRSGAKIDRDEESHAFAMLDRSKLTADERSVLDKGNVIWMVLRPDEETGKPGPESQLLLIPPAQAGQDWQPIISVLGHSDDIPESAASFLKIANDYARDLPQDFNADLAAYQSRIQSLPEMSGVDYEVRFNHVSPFYLCIVLYVCIFLTAFFSWLFWTKPLWRTGYALMVLALIVHTVGIGSRIWISGRPPVTNLYSASVFIGWAIVLFSLGLEAIFRNGIGLVAGATAGFLSLLVAAGFASGDGDTMRQLQAVLDTNWWLATHVVCVTMGYMATVLAGILAMIYIIRGVSDRSFAGDDAKDNTRMIYGIICFGLLFSFVGTILGGIWADQSWGRFWGWDPKENGAVLVVLWNALILHSRWAGVVKERGMAVLAICGNIVVGWSFVGTNLMGVGLHSYGFMSGAQTALLCWVGANLAIASVGLTPKRFWAISKVG